MSCPGQVVGDVCVGELGRALGFAIHVTFQLDSHDGHPDLEHSRPENFQQALGAP